MNRYLVAARFKPRRSVVPLEEVLTTHWKPNWESISTPLTNKECLDFKGRVLANDSKEAVEYFVKTVEVVRDHPHYRKFLDLQAVLARTDETYG